MSDTQKVTTYIPRDLLKEVKKLAIDKDLNLSELHTRALLLYSRLASCAVSGGDDEERGILNLVQAEFAEEED